MKKDAKAFGALEYIFLLTLIMLGFIVMGPYITNAFNGYFRRAGENMDYLRQHDPYRTRDCIWDPRLSVDVGIYGRWYSEKCYNHYNQGCYTATADDLDHTMDCRANAEKQSLCNSGLRATCPTTCCMTDAKSACLLPCGTMPAPDGPAFPSATAPSGG